MSPRINDLGQPIGPALPDWNGVARPPRAPIEGRFCRIEPIDPARHAMDLFNAFALDAEGRNWTYLGYDRTETFEPFKAWMESACLGDDPLFHTIIDLETEKAVGVAALMRIDPANGVIEVGNIHYSPLLQKRPAATEAMYLLMRRVFAELGYRRYEWKCDSLNAPSRAAAQRLGFTYDGEFPNAVVYKGRSRDTTWFSIVDRDWPAIAAAYEDWLAPANFDDAGRQKASLGDRMARRRLKTTA